MTEEDDNNPNSIWDEAKASHNLRQRVNFEDGLKMEDISAVAYLCVGGWNWVGV